METQLTISFCLWRLLVLFVIRNASVSVLFFVNSLSLSLFRSHFKNWTFCFPHSLFSISAHIQNTSHIESYILQILLKKKQRIHKRSTQTHTIIKMLEYSVFINWRSDVCYSHFTLLFLFNFNHENILTHTFERIRISTHATKPKQSTTYEVFSHSYRLRITKLCFF